MADKKFFNYHQLSTTQIYKIKHARWKARTDLQYLCNKILGYKDVTTYTHGPLINFLQKFPVPNQEQWEQYDDFSTGYVKYRPVVLLDDFVNQEKVKRRLIIDSRGFFKTTINVVAHSIQTILNYPNISGLIIQSNIEKAESFLKEIKEHFQYNSIFRELFPEHVPYKKINDWYTKGQFTTEAFDPNNLLLGQPHREGTMITGGIDKGMAGTHVDFIKVSDIVDTVNSKSAESCNEITKQFNLCENLLTSVKYWIDVEGTRYSFADTYGSIIKREMALPEEMRKWKFYVRGCYKKKTKDGLPQKFTPEELYLPDLVDESAKNPRNPLGKVSWFPERAPAEDLEHARMTKPFEFASQQYNNPMSAEQGMQPFPVNSNPEVGPLLPKYITRKIFDEKIPKAYYEISVDTAETNHQKSNYTAISVACWSGSGRCYIVDIIHGKFLPDVLIDNLFRAYLKYKPRNIKIEETSFVRGLMAGIKREGERLGVNLPIQLIKRENQTAKQERIINTLQPYYTTGQLVFLDDLKAKDKLLEELIEFPSGSQDDILDSLADFFQNKEYFGREMVREEDLQMENRERGAKLHQEYLKAYPVIVQTWLDTGNPFTTGVNTYIGNTYDRTGGL